MTCYCDIKLNLSVWRAVVSTWGWVWGAGTVGRWRLGGSLLLDCLVWSMRSWLSRNCLIFIRRQLLRTYLVFWRIRRLRRMRRLIRRGTWNMLKLICRGLWISWGYIWRTIFLIGRKLLVCRRRFARTLRRGRRWLSFWFRILRSWMRRSVITLWSDIKKSTKQEWRNRRFR